jgi:uncharacterized protein (TIGR03546 family)
MLFTRKFGKLLLGKATPAQLMLASVLGAMTGFVPSFSTSWGLILALTLAIIILNANFFLAITVASLCKLLSLAAMPLSYLIGQVLLDSGLGAIFKPMINAPILAFFGLEYYVTTGGLVVSAVVGVGVGVGIVRGVKAIRAKLVNMDENSEAFKKWSQKRWVKILIWLVFGGKITGMEERFDKKGKVIRPLGVVLALLIVGLTYVMSLFLDDAIVRSQIASQLQSLNGATVNIKSATLSFSSGEMTLEGLEIADPDNLEYNRFQADKLSVKLDTYDLLRGRLVLDLVESDASKTGVKRTRPAVRNKDAHKFASPEQPEDEEGMLDEYIKSPEKIYEKLQSAKEWLKRAEEMMGSDSEAAEKEKKESTSDMLAHLFDVGWYIDQKADQLIEGSPDFLLRKCVIKGLEGVVDGQTLEVTTSNFSTHPRLVDGAPSVEIKTSGDLFDVNLSLTDLKDPKTPGTIHFQYNGLTVEQIAGELKAGGDKNILEGGTVSVSLDGQIRTVGQTWIDLPLKVELKNTYLVLPTVGKSPEAVNIPVTIGLKGPIDRPAITFDHEAFMAALQEAGSASMQAWAKNYADDYKKKADAKIAEAKKKIDDKVTAKTDEAKKKLGDKIGDKIPGGLGGLLGGNKDDAKATTPKTDKDPDPVKKGIDDALNNLLKPKATEPAKDGAAKEDPKADAVKGVLDLFKKKK